MTTTTTQAAPETGTVKQVAWCKHCDEQIEKTPVSKGWYHAYTGKASC